MLSEWRAWSNTRTSNDYSKGHEPESYETLLVIAGLLFKVTIVMIRGPNKSLNHEKKVVYLKFLRWGLSHRTLSIYGLLKKLF